MTNYNDGNWHGWNGGECPVHPETVVECVCFMETTAGVSDGCADEWNWVDDDYPIIAFRVIKEHKEPREFWLAFNEKGEAADYSENVDELCHMTGWTCALFREVTP